MTYAPRYCTATHENSPDGCYEASGHEGQHRGILDGMGYRDFFWPDAPAKREDGAVPVYLTAKELTMLGFILDDLPRAKDVLQKFDDALDAIVD